MGGAVAVSCGLVEKMPALTLHCLSPTATAAPIWRLGERTEGSERSMKVKYFDDSVDSRLKGSLKLPIWKVTGCALISGGRNLSR